MTENNKFLKMSRDEYDKYMCKTYPDFFKDRNKPMNVTCMCWGFDIGKGWYSTLDEVCRKLTEIKKVSGIDFAFDQIKEKYGGGRFYFHASKVNEKNETWYNIAESIVSQAELDVDCICADCAESYYEKIIIGGWFYDICPKCFSNKFPERKDALDVWKKHRKTLEEITGYVSDIHNMGSEEDLDNLKKFASSQWKMVEERRNKKMEEIKGEIK